MKKAIARLPAFDEEEGCVNAIVETPKGSRVKYTYLPDAGLFSVKRALPEGMMFPFNFGFIPSTLADDGDPLDIVVVNQEPILTGCLIHVRLLAVLEAEQREKDGKTNRNDRIIGMAIDEETPPEFQSTGLDDARLVQIGFFFSSYNKLSGKKFKVLGHGDPKQAEKLIREAMKKFEKQNKE